ncbi:MAG TPA: choice-of-anchor D domain-containing protein [Candidatus Binataceae bacterium]|nr:choice-of-anchor D domain-containing protein [Candidatus Binataceae bacterium]
MAALCLALASIALLTLAWPTPSDSPGAGDTSADRELGQADLAHNMLNFGGAAALSNPSGIAIDNSDHLYIADSSNNRVLGWISASAFADGAPADLVIGQPDFYSYRCDDGTAPGDVNGVGADSLCGPRGVAVDGTGNLYIADAIDNRVLVYVHPFTSGSSHGQPASIVFGQNGSFTARVCNGGQVAGDAAGLGRDSLCDPRAVALDAAANLFVADTGNNRVLEYNTPLNSTSGESGAGDTLAELVFGQNLSFTTRACNNGQMAGDVNGIGPDSLCGPAALALDTAGSLFVSDSNNSRILEYHTPLSPGGGLGGAGDTIADTVFGQNGSFTSAVPNGGAAGLGADSLLNPRGLVLDMAGNLYVADRGNNRILQFNPASTTAAHVFGQSGVFTEAQCDGNDGGMLAGFGAVVGAATLCTPADVALDAVGNLYALDSGNRRMLVFDTPLNGQSGEPGAGDTTADRELGQSDLDHNMDNFGGARALTLANPAQTGGPAAHLAIDTAGHLYAADTANNRVLGWASAAAFADGEPAALVIGQPDFFSYGCDDGRAAGDVEGVGPDSLCEPSGVAVDTDASLYVADSADNRVLMYAPPFASDTNAGQSAATVFGQGGSFTATAAGAGPAGLNDPRAVALDPDGNLFVADTENNRVLEYLTPRGPGGGTPGTPGAAGDTTADAVVGQDGSFTRVECNDGTAPGDVDGVGPDSLCRPAGLALEAKHRLYVADYENSRVLEYVLPLDSAVAGFVFGQNGSFTTRGCNHGAAGLGPDSLCNPSAVALDSKRNLYLADSGDNRVLEYNAPLEPDAARTFAADRVFGQDGFTAVECDMGAVAVSAETLCAPNGLAVDGADNLYIADSGNNRVLEYNEPLVGAPSPTPTATLSPTPTASPSPTPTATPSPSPTPTGTPSPTPSATPTSSATPTATSTPTPTLTPTPTATPTPTPTPTPLPPGGVLSVPSQLLFGKVGVGVAPKTRTLKISNLGPARKLTVMLGTVSAPFALLSAPGPFQIAPLGMLGVKIRFTPTAFGPVSQTFTIRSGDVRHPSANVKLSGNGRSGQLSLPTTTLFFGKVGIGVAPRILGFKITNAGIGRLNGSVGTLSAPFSVVEGAGPFNLLPQAAWRVRVGFAPQSVGPAASTLKISSDDPLRPSTDIAISGTGVAGHLRIDLPSPPTLAFGAVAAGSALAKSFTITNSAKGLLRGKVGTLDAPFTVTLGAGDFTLQPGQKRTLRVRFSPSATGKVVTSLTITVEAPSAPASATVTIAGKGV